MAAHDGTSAGPLGSPISRLLLLELLDEVRVLQEAAEAEVTSGVGAYVQISLGAQLARLQSLGQRLRTILESDAVAQPVGGTPSRLCPGVDDVVSVRSNSDSTAPSPARADRDREAKSRSPRRLSAGRFSGAAFFGIFHDLSYSGPQN